MGKLQFNLSQKGEMTLARIKYLSLLNKIESGNKGEQVEQGLEWLSLLLDKLSESDVNRLLNIKK